MGKKYFHKGVIASMLIIISFLFHRCELIDELFNNEDDNQNAETTEWVKIETHEIDQTGGTIDHDSIIILIPAGAFNESQKISINAAPKNEFEGHSNSTLFQIQGLPEKINSPIEIKLRCKDEIDGDTLMAIGTKGYSVSLDSLLFSYYTQDASFSDGYIKIKYSPNINQLKSFGSEEDLLKNVNFIALQSYLRSSSPNNYFTISCPATVFNHSKKLGKYFEAAMDTCLAIGFDLTSRTFPVPVLVRELSNELGHYTSYHYGKSMTDAQLQNAIDLGTFEISTSTLSNDNELKYTAAHEFLHLVQNLYEFSSAEIMPQQSWLMEASAVWFEEKFSDDIYFISSSHINREVYPFLGWQMPAYTFSDHGYGLSIIFKELYNLYRDKGILQTFEEIKKGVLPNQPTDPVDAIENSVNIPLEEFSSNILKNYITGNYHDYKSGFKILGNNKNYLKTITIGENEPKHNFALTLNDLSGALIKLTPGDLTALNDVPVTLSVDDPVMSGVALFQHKNNSEISILDYTPPGGNGMVKIENIKPILNNGYSVVGLITNGNHSYWDAYQGKKTINVNIEIEKPNNLNTYLLNSNLYTMFIRVMMYNATEGQSENDWYNFIDNDDLIGHIIQEGFSENGDKYVYKGEVAKDDYYIYGHTDLELRFNESRTAIEYIQLDQKRVDPRYSGDLVQELSSIVTINEEIPIVDSNIEKIYNNGKIEYTLHLENKGNFTAYTKEIISSKTVSGENVWEYYDSKGVRREVKIKMVFRINYDNL